MFFLPPHLIETLDNDLFGTRAAENQVKMLSARKTGKEDHSSDAIADAFFRLVLKLRLQRSRTDIVCSHILFSILEEKG